MPGWPIPCLSLPAATAAAAACTCTTSEQQHYQYHRQAHVGSVSSMQMLTLYVVIMLGIRLWQDRELCVRMRGGVEVHKNQHLLCTIVQ
jgi:hypothetical protein